MFKLLAINKVSGESSFFALNKVKRYFGTKKVGHMGTLDLLAEGVLAVAVGDATKVIPYLKTEPKEYVVEIFFGMTTPGFDAEGIDKNEAFILAEKVDFTQDEMLEKLEVLRARNWQFPPKFSAIKIEGARAYKLARQGVLDEAKIKKKFVDLYEFELLDFKLPIVKLRLSTSSGYYVRSLVRDLAEMLGVEAFMFSLQRTRVGEFSLENCSDLENDEVRELDFSSLVNDFRKIELSEAEVQRLRTGIVIQYDEEGELGKQILQLAEKSSASEFLIVWGYFDGELSSLLEIDLEKKMVRPVKNFNL